MEQWAANYIRSGSRTFHDDPSTHTCLKLAPAQQWNDICLRQSIRNPLWLIIFVICDEIMIGLHTESANQFSRVIPCVIVVDCVLYMLRVHSMTYAQFKPGSGVVAVQITVMKTTHTTELIIPKGKYKTTHYDGNWLYKYSCRGFPLSHNQLSGITTAAVFPLRCVPCVNSLFSEYNRLHYRQR